MRWMLAAAFVNTLGSGLFASISVLYFTQVVGLGVGSVATVMTVAALISLVTAVPLGHLGDRFGHHRTQTVLLTTMGVAALANAFVDELWQYALIATVLAVADRGVAAVTGALVADLTSGPERVRTRARFNVVFSLGLVSGSLLALVVLALGTPTAYWAAIAFDAFTFLVAGLLYLKLPRTSLSAPASPWTVFRDRRFVSVVAVYSVLEMHRVILVVALPIWIVREAGAPAVLVPVVVAVNLLGVVLLQIPVARRAETVPAAIRLTRLGGGLLLVACLLFAGVPALGPGLLLSGVLVQTAGDLVVSSARFCITFELADDRAQGQYQAFVSVGRGLTNATAPATMALLPLGLGLLGWLVLGLLLFGAALLIRPAVMSSGQR